MIKYSELIWRARRRSSAWSQSRRQTGPRPWPSPWRSCPKRWGVRPCRAAAERTVVADLVLTWASADSGVGPDSVRSINVPLPREPK